MEEPLLTWDRWMRQWRCWYRWQTGPSGRGPVDDMTVAGAKLAYDSWKIMREAAKQPKEPK